jgi:HTH-type transcriptional regulator/antitoxin HigA
MTTVILDFSRPHVLRDEREYEAAVAELDALAYANPGEGTDEYDRMVFLSVLVEAYEAENDPIDTLDVTPQQVVRFALEQKGMGRVDLHEVMGGKSRVSEFFNGKRGLSLPQAKRLRDLLGIPLDALVS